MLGSKAKSAPATKNRNTASMSTASDRGATCVIAEGTHIDGQFNSTENVRIDGTVEGNIQCQNKLVMGTTGKITGDVQAGDAVINGTIEGTITCSGLLQLTSTAKIYGTITAKHWLVEEGATFVGECNIGG